MASCLIYFFIYKNTRMHAYHFFLDFKVLPKAEFAA